MAELNINRLRYIILKAIMQWVVVDGLYPTVSAIQCVVSDACGARPTHIQDTITELINSKLVVPLSNNRIDVTSAGELWATVVYPEYVNELSRHA